MIDNLRNLNLTNIIDVGAHIGNFSKELKRIYPNAKFILVEGNYRCEQYLYETEFEFDIRVLSDEKKSVKFYTHLDNPINTGSSYYKENTTHFEKSNVDVIITSTLDEMQYFNDEEISLLKLDTQGSELDIINGGHNTLQRVKYILIETSTIEYNIGAPLMNTVFEKLNELSFKPMDLISSHLTKAGIFQVDFLFKNTKLI